MMEKQGRYGLEFFIIIFLYYFIIMPYCEYCYLLWSDSVNTIASQPYKMQSWNSAGV